jgi:hypothetical protein
MRLPYPPRQTGSAELRAYRALAWPRDHGCDVHEVCLEAIDTDEERSLILEDDIYHPWRCVKPGNGIGAIDSQPSLAFSVARCHQAGEIERWRDERAVPEPIVG